MCVICNFHIQQLRTYQGICFFHQLLQFKLLLFQRRTFILDLTHIQHVIHERQKMTDRYPYFIQALIHLSLICPAPFYDLEHSYDSIDRGTDIMAHPIQEFRFGTARQICFLKCRFQPFLFLFLLFMEGRGIFEQNNRMDDCTFLSCSAVIHCLPGKQNHLLYPGHDAV